MLDYKHFILWCFPPKVDEGLHFTFRSTTHGVRLNANCEFIFDDCESCGELLWPCLLGIVLTALSKEEGPRPLWAVSSPESGSWSYKSKEHWLGGVHTFVPLDYRCAVSSYVKFLPKPLVPQRCFGQVFNHIDRNKTKTACLCIKVMLIFR